MTENVNANTRFERTDVSLGPLIASAGGVAVLVVVAALVCWWVFDVLQARDRATKVSPFPLAAEERDRLPSERQPRLEQIERMEAAKKQQPPSRLYDAELRRLDTYGWVDERQQIAHIPIDQAMKMIVEQKRLRSRAGAADAGK